MNYFNGESDMPSIMLGIVVSLLTIIISVAIAIFSEKKSFEVLDRNVILDHVVKAKYLIIYLGMAFVPLLFWNIDIFILKILIIPSWIIGVFCIVDILSKSYFWMKGAKYRLRFEYLESLKNFEDIEGTWNSVWQEKNINYENEKKFFEIFQKQINYFLINDNIESLKISSKLINDFENCICIRLDFILLVSAEIFNAILEWHFLFWKKEAIHLNGSDHDKFIYYDNLYYSVNEIFKKIEKRALIYSRPYQFFNLFKKHSEKYEKETVSSRKYIKYLFDNFYNVYFENIYNSPARFDIWNHYFPNNWKITKSNITNQENIISKISLSQFLKFAYNKINQSYPEKKFDLDDISIYLFQEVDPMLWSIVIYVFVFSPDEENQFRILFERKWQLGFMGRIKAYDISMDEEVDKISDIEAVNTYDLALFLFSNHFNQTKIDEYLQILQKISYEDDSIEERNRLKSYHFFNKMKSYLII